jgi:hypothetical protein
MSWILDLESIYTSGHYRTRVIFFLLLMKIYSHGLCTASILSVTSHFRTILLLSSMGCWLEAAIFLKVVNAGKEFSRVIPNLGTGIAEDTVGVIRQLELS